MPILDIVLKSSGLLLIASLATSIARRRPSAQRHYIWTLTMAGLLLLPGLAAVLPSLPLLPAALPTADVAARQPATLATTPGAARAPSFQRQSTEPRLQAREALSPPPAFSPRRVATWMLTGWWIVSLALVCWRLGLSSLALLRLLRGARPITDDAWWIDLDEAATRLGVRTPVRLLESPRAAIPMTFGLRRSVIVVPSDARDWPADQRRVVLLHELAHIRRGDARANLLSQAVCALYWFHPLVWGAARRLRIEAERACDDLVLGAGAAPSAYAAQLLSFVQSIAAQRAPALALPLAQRSAFEGRVLAILEPGMKRQPLSSRAALIGATALLGIAVPLAALAPAQEPAPRIRHVSSAPGYMPAPTPTPRPMPNPSPMPTPTPTPSPSPDVGNDVHVHINPHVRVDVGDTGRQAHDPLVVTALTQALADPDAELRTTAAHSLGELGDTAAVSALINALRRDASPEVRKTAAWALGQIEDKSSVPGLIASLHDERDVEVRRQVAWALGQIEAAEAVPGIGAALQSESDAETKRMLVWALGQIENKESVRYLIPLLHDTDAELRGKVAWALGQIESHEAVEAIAAAYTTEREPEVKQQLLWALGQIEDRRAVPTLVIALRDSSLEVRKKAIWALGQIDDNTPEVTQALIAAMHDSDPEIRRLAAHALGNR